MANEEKRNDIGWPIEEPHWTYLLRYSTDLRENCTGVRIIAPDIQTAIARGMEYLRVLEDPTYQSDELKYTTDPPPPAILKWAYVQSEKHWLVPPKEAGV